MERMAQHPSTPAGPRAGLGAETAPGPSRPPHMRASLEALILSMLLRLLAGLLGEQAAQRGSSLARLAPLLALWSALPTRRLTRRTRGQAESIRAQAAQAAALRALRRLAACIGWFINGRRNRGMRPAAAQPARPRPLRPPRAPPSAASNGSLPPLAGGGRNPRQHGWKDSESRRQGLVQFIPTK